MGDPGAEKRMTYSNSNDLHESDAPAGGRHENWGLFMYADTHVFNYFVPDLLDRLNESIACLLWTPPVLFWVAYPRHPYGPSVGMG